MSKDYNEKTAEILSLLNDITTAENAESVAKVKAALGEATELHEKTVEKLGSTQDTLVQMVKGFGTREAPKNDIQPEGPKSLDEAIAESLEKITKEG